MFHFKTTHLKVVNYSQQINWKFRLCSPFFDMIEGLRKFYIVCITFTKLNNFYKSISRYLFLKDYRFFFRSKDLIICFPNKHAPSWIQQNSPGRDIHVDFNSFLNTVLKLSTQFNLKLYSFNSTLIIIHKLFLFSKPDSSNEPTDYQLQID